MTNPDELERLARAAGEVNAPDWWFSADALRELSISDDADRDFIAAANPETIRQLVELVRLQHFLILGYAGYNTREEIRRQSVIEAFNKWVGK